MRCLKCFRTDKNCLCAEIVPQTTKCFFVILMHPMEFKREKNGTGHLTHLSLLHSEIIVDINFTSNTRLNSLLLDVNYQPFLLYPGENALNLHHENFEAQLNKQKTPMILIIDATWSHAKKMMRESTNLHDLPRLSFDNVKKSAFYIKQQPQELCLSTIESVHLVLDLLIDQGYESDHLEHGKLLELFQKMIDFQIKCSLDTTLPNYHNKTRRGYSDPKTRKESKKWENRSLIYECKSKT